MTELLNRNAPPVVDVLSLPDNFLNIEPMHVAALSSYQRSAENVEAAFARFAHGQANLRDCPNEPTTAVGELVNTAVGKLTVLGSHAVADIWRGAGVGQLLVEARETRRDPTKPPLYVDYPQYTVAHPGDFKLPEVEGTPEVYGTVLQEIIDSSLRAMVPGQRGPTAQALYLQQLKDTGVILDRAGVGVNNFSTALKRVSGDGFEKTHPISARLGATLLVLSTGLVETVPPFER
jgi:hypothetical protein